MESLVEVEKAFITSRIHYLTSDSCGYCKCQKERSGGLRAAPDNAGVPEKPTHITIGCQVEQMTCSQYDDFINRGFRRSGTFMYTGDMLRGCCRMYTIRTDLDHLKIIKEHRQVINRFKRAIGDETKTKGKFSLRSLIDAEKKSTRFHTRFEPSGFSKEKYELYRKYQVRVHNDDPEDVTPKQFKRFLCETPFPEREVMGAKGEWDRLGNWVKDPQGKLQIGKKRIGPTHECYYLDNKLIAISVLDFLPTGLSSIYFIWDPDFAHLSLGTLSGLREIQMCQVLELGYYYLGYYIDDCHKMRYKAKFGGEVLDLVNNAWVDLEKARPLMEGDSFFALGDPTQATQEPERVSSEPSIHWDKPIQNINEALYEKPETYAQAKKISTEVRRDHDTSEFELPDVLPGAMSMASLKKSLASAAPELSSTLFIMSIGRWAAFPFETLPDVMKSYVIDFIRLFGYERLQETIMIVLA